jgi:hypothetical protein
VKTKTLGAFVLGVTAGAVAFANWRPLVKKGVRAGMDLRTATMRYAEDLSDVIKQAAHEERSVNSSSSPMSGNGVTGAGRVLL